MTKPVAKDYFLSPQNSTDPRQFRGAMGTARDIKLIVDGNAIFRALEEAIVDAKKSVLIAFWVLNPGLKLLSDRAKQFGRTTWADLLLGVANNGVLVRVLMNDFDPGFKHVEHIFTWARYRTLVKRAGDEAIPEANFQVVCARHEAEVPAETVKLAGKSGIYDQIAETLNKAKPDERAIAFANGPGLWEKLEWQKDKKTIVPKKKGESYPAFPAAYHQKIVIVDGRIAFTGGINLIDENLDTPKHSPTTTLPFPWHDVFVKIEGELVQDIMSNFFGIWNHERRRSETFLRDALTKTIAKMPVGSTTDLSFTDVPIATIDKTKSQISSQVHRTISKKGTSKNGVPDVVREDILEGYLKAISLAQDFIYIENQYFRERVIADAIIAQHKKQSALRTIIVLPKIAEELMDQKGDAITFHGASLQFEALELMQTSIGRNLGLFSMVTGEKAAVVYVHSKLLIIDDVYAGVGSANTNPRSFRMDTELHLAWYDKRTASGLRQSLWAEILGSPQGMSSWTPKQFVDKWSDIAKRNLDTAPKSRKRFVIPFVNNIKGQKHPLIPDQFA